MGCFKHSSTGNWPRVLNAHRQVLKAAFQYCLTISLSSPKDIDVLKEQLAELDLRLSAVENSNFWRSSSSLFSEKPEDNIKLHEIFTHQYIMAIHWQC